MSDLDQKKAARAEPINRKGVARDERRPTETTDNDRDLGNGGCQSGRDPIRDTVQREAVMDRNLLSTQAGWRAVPSPNEHPIAFMQFDPVPGISAQSPDSA